jgi:two-component system phosphate regulon response regulator PhoB
MFLRGAVGEERTVTSIVVVDDAPEIRDIVAMFLTDEGFAVTAYERVDAALARLAVSLPDLLILHGRLPEISGWQCLHDLRASERTNGLPILMLTAAVNDVDRARQEPPDDCTAFLTKPFNLDELLDAIHDVIDTCDRRPVAV